MYRSDKVDGNYDKINSTFLSTSTRLFEDQNPSHVNYYKIRSEDENGYKLASNVVLGQPQDSIPPNVPVGLVGESDKSGLVTLKWQSNSEEDLMGYRVFISNTISGDFVQITNNWVNDTIFQYQINLNTLSEYVYFAIKAIDFRQNPSELSLPCTVERPDIIPPSPPSISKVTAEPGRVNFEWELSSSNDARDHKFQRKPNGAPGWVTLVEFTGQNPLFGFIDSTASFKQYWDYRLIAIDEVGLVGSSKVIKAKPVDTGIRDSVLNFSSQLVSGGTVDSFVDLGWDYTHDPDLEGFEIFRAIDNNEKRSFKFVSIAEAINSQSQLGANFGYLDFDTDFKNVPVQTSYSANLQDAATVVTGGVVSVNGNTYTIVPISPNVAANPQAGVTVHYWIMAKFIDGATSPLSNEVVIQIN